MGLFDIFRRRDPASSKNPEGCVVTFDDDSVVRRRPSGLVESVQWSDLTSVIIQTTDEGPFVDDVFWILTGTSSGCIVPSEAEGVNGLLKRLQNLPGFDDNAAMKAMTCTQNQQFLCWQRDDPE